MLIAILDYTVGNVGSLISAFKRLGAEARVTRNPDELRKFDVLVLPGVGTYSAAYELAYEAEDFIKTMPTLGICLGMQLLFERSEEGGGEGLGIFPKPVEKIKARKIPHIGWSLTKPTGSCPLVEEDYYYYLHSYGARFGGLEYEGAYIELLEKYTAVVCKDNIIGVQFHPERSSKAGAKFLSEFLRWARR